MEILVVEDDQRMAALLERGLQREGHCVFVAANGRQGVEYASARSYDVIVLDVLLPVMDGYEVARRLRQKGNRTPILILTAKDSPRDAVQGLDAGADDYMKKPFSFGEFLARVRAVSRRGPIATGPLLQVCDLTLDPASHEVRRGTRGIRLTPREYQILEILIRRAGRVIPRDTLLDDIWGDSLDAERNTVDVFVSSLRRKTEGPGERRLIHTVRGVGFCLKEPGE
ncbi:MAG: response regulator transcription factor [Bryobacteraceae bacterium]